MFTLRHPDPQFSGELYGVQFVVGTAVTANANAVRHFRRRAERGYVVAPIGDEVALESDTAPSRDDLIAAAETLGITVPARATKSEITDLIELATP